MRLSCLRRELRNIGFWVLFMASPVLVLLTYFGVQWWGWSGETEVHPIVAVVLAGRYSADGAGVTVLVMFVLALTSVGLAWNYRKRMPRNEKAAVLRWLILAQKGFSGVFYFWSGGYVGLWLGAILLPFLSPFPGALILAFVCFLVSFSVACYARDLKVAIANG